MELSLTRLLTVYMYINCVLIVCEIGKINAQRTFLDKFITEYRTFRGGIFKFVGRTDTDSAYLWNLKRQVYIIKEEKNNIINERHVMQL